MKANLLLIIIFLMHSGPVAAIQRFSITERLRDMKDHQEELEYQKAVVDKDMRMTEQTLKSIYPQCKNLETRFRSLYEEIKRNESRIKELDNAENNLKKQIRETTMQLVAAKKQMYLNKKFNKKLPPFLSRSNPDEAVNIAIIRLETKEKILYQQIQRIRDSMRENKGRISNMRKQMAEIRPTLLERKAKYKSIQQIYKDLKTQRLDYVHQKEDLQRELEKYLRGLPDRSGLFSKPLLIQPAAGQVEYLEEDYNTFHAGGAIINTHTGEEILSPGNGTVSFRGPLRRFGNIILIDHGGRWHSLISGVNPTVAVGQDIKRGQIIGKVSEELGGRIYVELMKEGRTRLVTFH